MNLDNQTALTEVPQDGQNALEYREGKWNGTVVLN